MKALIFAILMLPMMSFAEVIYQIPGLLDDANTATVSFSFVTRRDCDNRICKIPNQAEIRQIVEESVRLAMIGFDTKRIINKRFEYADKLLKELNRKLGIFGYVTLQVNITKIDFYSNGSAQEFYQKQQNRGI